MDSKWLWQEPRATYKAPQPTTGAPLPALQNALTKLDASSHQRRRSHVLNINYEAANALHALHKAASSGTGECTLRALSITLEQEPILHFKLKQSLGGGNGYNRPGGAVSSLLEVLEDCFQGNVFSHPLSWAEIGAAVLASESVNVHDDARPKLAAAPPLPLQPSHVNHNKYNTNSSYTNSSSSSRSSAALQTKKRPWGATANWSISSNRNKKSSSSNSGQSARTQSVNFFKHTFNRPSFMPSTGKSSSSSSSSSLTFFQRLLQNLPAYNESSTSSSSSSQPPPTAAPAPSSFSSLFGGGPPAEEKDDASSFSADQRAAETTATSDKGQAFASAPLGGAAGASSSASSSSSVSSIETPLAWAGLDALTCAAAKIRQRAADEIANATKVQETLEQCTPALEKLEANSLDGGEEEEEEEEIVAKVNRELAQVARWLDLRDEEEEEEEKEEEKREGANILTASKSGSFKYAGADEEGEKDNRPLPLAPVARIQLTALYEDCRQRLKELYQRWQEEKEAAVAEAAAAKAREAEEAARAKAAAADGSAGALKRPLTASEAAEVAAAWAYPEGSEAVVCSLPAGAGGSTVDILGKHMARMRCGWLFDETINMYMWLLQQRDNAWVAQDPQTRKPTYFFSSFFFEKMFENHDTYNYGSVKRWSKKVSCTGGNIFKLGKMVVPVNVGGSHWCLCVAHVTEGKVQYYDSMGGGGSRYREGLKQYFLDEAKKVPDDPVAQSVASWEEVPTVAGTPQQDNGIDCGVFTCYFANYVSAKKHMNFSARDMPLFRRRLTLDILRKTVE